MPIYEYECVDCGCREQRVTGTNDHTVICAACGGIMARLDLDWFALDFLTLDQDREPLRLENVN
jgi:putative FmdB family regulatory protein